MTFVTRYSTSALMAGFVTISLFLLMALQVMPGDKLGFEIPKPNLKIIYFQQPAVTPRLVPMPLCFCTMPPLIFVPDPPKKRTVKFQPIGDMYYIEASGFKPEIIVGEISTGSQSPTLIAAPAPRYPRMYVGKEGFALLEFTVDEYGNVINPTVIDEYPRGYGFGREAIRAALNFRYEPATLNGEPIATEGVRFRIIFELLLR